MIPIQGDNALLAALPRQELLRVLDRCEPATLARDDLLIEPGAPQRHAWFPICGFLSLQAGKGRHDTLASALVGREGMLGASLVLGTRVSPLLARVQAAGTALRIPAAELPSVLAETPALERRLRQYVHALLGQFAQTARCAVFHVVETRLACLLLMAHDRTPGDRLLLTHDRLASMLGVRRSGVTAAAGVLQRAELIGYTRGHIAILDRRGLERAACGCYRAVYSVRAASQRVAGVPPHRRRREPLVA